MRVPSLKPVFFFTDKDFGQIHVFLEVYGVTLSLCLRHLKRAVKRKIDEPRLRKVKDVSKSKETSKNDDKTL